MSYLVVWSARSGAVGNIVLNLNPLSSTERLDETRALIAAQVQPQAVAASEVLIMNVLPMGRPGRRKKAKR